jgi:6-phosphogluconolactonase
MYFSNNKYRNSYNMDAKINIFENPSEVAKQFAKKLHHFFQTNEPGIKGTYNIAFSGGNTPKILFDELATNYKDKLPWEKINFFFVDERFVPYDDPESNYGMTKKHLLDKIDLPDDQVFPVNTSSDPEEEPNEYATYIFAKVPQQFGVPRFHLIVLGMGEDGHTASIFPDQIMKLHSDKICDSAVHPVTKQQRVTFTGKLINNAENIFVLTTGENKAAMVDMVFNQEMEGKRYPIAHIMPILGNMEWYLDKAAAKHIKQG